MQVESNGNYECSDFYLVAFLMAKGYKILQSKRAEKKIIFLLEADDKLAKLVKQFYNREDSVPALDYKNAIADLKSLIYNT